MLNNVFIIAKFKVIRKYKKKMKIKFINFETSIDSFYYFFSKELMNENINNSKSKRSFLNFNNDLTKTFEKTFRSFYNNFDKISFFDNENDTSSTTFYI